MGSTRLGSAQIGGRYNIKSSDFDIKNETGKNSEKKRRKKSGEKKRRKKVTKKTLENQKAILNFMQPDVWYKISDFEGIAPVKESRMKELLKGLIAQGKITSTGNTKGKMYQKL